MITLQSNFAIMQRRTIIGQPERLALRKIIDLLSAHKFSSPFLLPVDYVQLGLVDYPLFVPQPMDLQTAKEKLRDHRYKCSEECLQDLLLIWENCRRYNEANNKVMVKWANEMEKYQKRITKNYFPALVLQPTRKNHNKKQTKMIKIEEKGMQKQDVKIEAVSIDLKEHKQQVKPLQEKQKPKVTEATKLQTYIILKEEEPKVKLEIRKETESDNQVQNVQNVQNVDVKTEVAILAQQAQKTLQVIKEVGQKILPVDRKWEWRGEQIRQEFLRSLGECNDCEVTLLFMMIKRRCPKCVHYDTAGNSTVDLQNIDDYTLALASQQITIWKNKASMGL